MGGGPSDGRFITGNVPPEMREGVDLTPGVEVAAPTERRFAVDPDGTTAQISQMRYPRPDHISAPPPLSIVGGDDVPLPRPRRATLRYEFPLFPDVQVTVEFQGNATADHLEQLTSLLNVQCGVLRQQEAERRTHIPAPRTPPPRKIREKKESPNGN